MPIDRDLGWLRNLLFALLLLLILAGLLWRFRPQRHRAALLAEPVLPPGLWALHEIDRRSRLSVCSAGPPKTIYTLASEVVRLYLQRRYHFSAIDMTTIECMRAFQQQAPGEDIIRWVQSFLDECDLVKFTRVEPPPERWSTVWHDARLIVTMTTPPEELGEAATATSAGAGEGGK